ncbi:RNA polymerase sigma factor [Lewinella sp. IMCC34183]|uniref:RNA polymerase sigma factor n=1 Tax=Lewinella sp. IMCC34183 TaxID=2248762 RepID=UPI000E22452D|nr:sigma-70 family RNA polymerase sigma factor [Lewinella sp. IMCC34183]
MSDEDLLAALRTAEDAAGLEPVYLKYREPCLRYLIGRVISPDYPNRQELAAELFTEALIILWENARADRLVELTSRLDTYLNAIARNLYRKLRRRNREIYRDPVELPESLVTPASDDDAELIRQEIHQKIRALGPRCRQLLTHFYFLQLDWTTCAELLGYKNAASAKTNKSKCMRRLRASYGLTRKTEKDERGR